MKKKVFKKSEEYKNKLKILNNQFNNLSTKYYFIEVKPSVQYNLKKQGVNITLDEKSNMAYNYPKKIVYILFSNLPIESSYYKTTYGENRFKQILFLKADENQGIIIEDDKLSKNLYLFFTIKSLKYINTISKVTIFGSTSKKTKTERVIIPSKVIAVLTGTEYNNEYESNQKEKILLYKIFE